MPITLITGPANAGKAQVVLDALRGHIARGEEPLLVVPTHADADHYRRELAGEGAVMGVAVERFDGLIGEAVRRAGVSSPALGSLARERLLGSLLARDGRTSRGMVRALGRFFGELQQRRVTPARLAGALAQWQQADGGAAFAGRAGALYGAYHRALEAAGRVDSEQRAALALDALRRQPQLWGSTPVLFYGFDDLAPVQIDAIETLGAVVGAPVTVSLTFEQGRTAFAGRAATFQALAPLADEHRCLRPRADYYAPRARGALSHLERSLFETDAPRVDPAGAVRLLEGGGERAELELVASEILALLGGDMGPGEIAVVLRAPEAAAELLEEVFAAAAIPYALQRRRPLADTAIGRALLGLLRCVPAKAPAGASREQGAGGAGGSAPASGGAPGSAEDLLAWLRAPGLLERAELADRLEADVRRAGAASAEQARTMWEAEHWPLEAIDRLERAQRRGAGALLEGAARELGRLFAAPRRRQASLLGGDELDEARALAAGRRALAELSELARSQRPLAPASASELAEVLAGVSFLSGEPPGPDAVAVLDPLALRARRVRALFVCRLQEGVFPAAEGAQPILAEEQRRELARTSGLRLGEQRDQLAAERYLLYATVSRPEELLVLGWHAADDDGAAATPSLFVDDVCDLFAEGLREGRVRRPLGAADGPLPEVAGQRSCEGAARPPAIAPLRDPRVLAELRVRTWSPSALEVWRRCPVSWLVERMLRPQRLEADPEPLVRGALAHAALRDTLERMRLRTGSARLTLARLDLARELLAEALDENEATHPLSPAPERRAGLRRRLQSDLERYLHQACTHPQELEPRHLELEFGFAPRQDAGFAAGQEGGLLSGEEGGEDAGLAPGEDAGLGPLDLGGGLLLRGRIDRIDVGAQGQAVVFDYKSKGAVPSAKWSAEGNMQVALYMRAAEQLLGLRAVGGFYQPLSGSDLRARGLLDEDGGVELECVGADRRESSEVQELLAQATAMAREAAAEAGRGELRPRPRSCSPRGGCMFPTICRCEAR